MMKRNGHQEADEDDPELLLAIANSLSYCEEDDPDLKRALVESMKRKPATSSELDRFYEEMSRDVTKRRVILDNHAHNSEFFVDDIIGFLMQHLTMQSMLTFYRTSNHIGKMMTKNLWRIRSLAIDSVALFLRVANTRRAKPRFFTALLENVDTYRLMIREPGLFLASNQDMSMPYIKHIVLNVTHMQDIKWFVESFIHYEGKLSVYHELDHVGRHSTTLIYQRIQLVLSSVTKKMVESKSVYLYPIKDTDGHLFNAFTNY